MAKDNSDNLNVLRSEGDLNISPLRKKWQQELIDSETCKWLELDNQYFLHQSLSTPCLDVLTGCNGSYLQNLQGRKILDFHGNNVHQVGFANPRVVQAINEQMEQLAFCTRRYTNIPAIQLAQNHELVVRQGNLLSDLSALIDEAPHDACLVIFHSAVLAYVNAEDRLAFSASLAEASRSRDIIWISNESPNVVPEITALAPQIGPRKFLLGRSSLTNGRRTDELLALTHPHGAELDWLL